MRKNISTEELESSVSEVMESVSRRGDRYIVECAGKPVAAIVPLFIDENYERSRRRFFEHLDEIAQRNKDVPPEELDAVVEQAIREVREERRKRRGEG